MKNLTLPVRLAPLLAGLILSACAHQSELTAKPGTPESKPAVAASKATAANDRDSHNKNHPSSVKAGTTVEPDVSKSVLNDEILYQLLVAEIAGQRGQIAEAIRSYVAAAMLSRDLSVVERSARIAVYARDDDALSKVGNLWVELQPANAEAHQVLAALHVRKGNGDKAFYHFDKVLQLSRHDQHKSFMLITSLLGKERDKKLALTIMDRLVSKYQGNASAYYGQANLAYLVNELSRAENAIQSALKLKPEWTEAHILYANILERQHKDEQLLEYIRHTLDSYPENTRLRLFYARKLVDKKHFQLSYDQFNQVYKESPDNTDALYALGLIAYQLKQDVLANKHFRALIEASNRIDEAHYYMGQIAERDSKPELAVEHYSESRKGRYQFESQLRIAILFGRQGKVEAARERLQLVNATTQEDKSRLYVIEGEILRENKLYKEAFDFYTDALKSMKDNVQILYARALMADKVERVDITLTDLKRVIELEPQNAQALNALGYTMVDQTDKVEEGLKFIRQAYALKPDDPAIVDSMGWAHYRLGKIKESLPYLKRAFELLVDPEIAAHLGEVLWVYGDKTQAKEVWDNALKLKPEHEALRDTIKRFVK